MAPHPLVSAMARVSHMHQGILICFNRIQYNPLGFFMVTDDRHREPIEELPHL